MVRCSDTHTQIVVGSVVPLPKALCIAQLLLNCVQLSLRLQRLQHSTLWALPAVRHVAEPYDKALKSIARVQPAYECSYQSSMVG